MKRLLLLSGALVLLLVLGASTALVSADQQPTRLAAQATVALEGQRWVLVSYVDADGAMVDAVADVEATAQFEKGRVRGSTGCNNYVAAYEAKGSSLLFGPAAVTMKACVEPVAAQETAFLAGLEAAASYAIAGDMLTIANADGDAQLVFVAQAPIALTDGTWVMTGVNNGRGGVVSSATSGEVTAIFGADGALSGSAGCNTYRAPFTVDGDKIEIGDAVTTMKMCEKQLMDQEQQYLAALKLAATYRIDGRKLELRSDTGALQVSYVQAPEAEATTTAAATVAPAPVPQEIPGMYLTLRPMASGDPATIVLHLTADGAAKYAVGDDEAEVVQTGTWEDNGDGTLTVTLTEQDNKPLAAPIVITFTRDGTYLVATEYDQKLFGEEGLQLNLAADVARKVGAALMTLDLAAGFPLDPTFMSVNGGGEVDANLLSDDCQGFINRNPVVTVNWTGKSDFVRAFFYSDHDATLVVLTPDGKLICNNNANEHLLDPVVDIKNPVPGTYRIWVGSTARRQLIPGIPVLTAKPEINLDSFDLSKLVQRPVMAVALPKPPTAIDEAALKQELAAAFKGAGTLEPGKPITAEVTADGLTPLFQFPVTKTCAGLVNTKPNYKFALNDSHALVRVFFEGDADATLLVVSEDGKIVECNDDAGAANSNPHVELKNPPTGEYAVFVGRLNPVKPVSGVLTITDAANDAPDVLAPAKP